MCCNLGLEYDYEARNTNKCQAKALESIWVRVGKSIWQCSVTICDKPVCAYLGLKTLRDGRDFRQLKWYRKVICMNDTRLPFKLLSNECDKVKHEGHPRKS